MVTIIPVARRSTSDSTPVEPLVRAPRRTAGPITQRQFVPAPPFPAVYGTTAAVALGLGLFGGFALGLYALGVLAFGWPAERYAPLVQAHGQVQIFGLTGLLILSVGGLLLPGFWRARLNRPQTVSYGAALVGVGLIAQIIGQPIETGLLRQALLALSAALPVAGFLWAGSEIVGVRLRQRSRPVAWELLLVLAGFALVGALLLRARYLYDLLALGLPASYGVVHQLLIAVELNGFVLAATIAVQLRLLPSLARTRPASGRFVHLGIAALTISLVARFAGLGFGLPALVEVSAWVSVLAAVAFFLATGLWRVGLAPTVQAPATLLPGRTRQVLRVTWGGLLVGEVGRATGLLSTDAATHAFTSVYLMPLILVVGLRMLPRVSTYPIQFPKLCGALIWAGLLGGILRAFGGLVGAPAGWQIAWFGGSILTAALVVFVALAWSPWGVPTGAPREPAVRLRT